MGSECNSSKPHYDLTMSKRTRKALNNPQEANANANANANENTNHSIFGRHKKAAADDREEEENESENEDRKSLKQLINGDETANEKSSTSSRATSLGRHLSEEEPQLQLVKKQQQCNNGVKFKGIVSRYAKVLSHLVKLKREPGLGSKKKHLLRLTNVG